MSELKGKMPIVRTIITLENIGTKISKLQYDELNFESEAVLNCIEIAKVSIETINVLLREKLKHESMEYKE